jgi:hypothetical protein
VEKASKIFKVLRGVDGTCRRFHKIFVGFAGGGNPTGASWT